jgi:hypothetical protein
VSSVEAGTSHAEAIIRHATVVEPAVALVAEPPLRSGSAITWPEVRWLAVACFAILLLVEVPYLLAYTQERHGYVFIGLLWSPHDFAQYAAAMRDGAASASWLIHDRLTAESHRPVLIYPLYVGLGKLTGLLGLDLRVVFHVVELAARGTLLVAIYVFSAAIYLSPGERRRALLLAVFSAGPGFWLLALDAIMPFMGERYSLFVLDLQMPDVSTFLALFVSPHNLLGLAFLLLAARGYLAAWSVPDLKLPILVGLSVLGVGLANPFSLITLCAVLPVHLALMRWQRGALPPRALLCAGAAFLGAAPFLAHSWLVFRTDPFWSVVYGQQNVTPSPPLPFLILSLAPILAFAVIGLPRFARGATPARMLVLVWIATSLVLMYAPVGYQRRFAFGIHPMLALVAASGLAPYWRPGPRESGDAAARSRPLLTFGLLLVLFASTACSYGLRIQAMSRPYDLARQGGAFHPVALREAGEWLASASGTDDVILAEALTGNYLAGLIPGRVFVGHPIATLRFAEKEAAVRRFYRGSDDHEARRQFLRANAIRYVVYGPYERAADASSFDSNATSEYLRPVYTSPDVIIYQVHEAVQG